MHNIRLVLDTNEYIGGLGTAKHPPSVELLNKILDSSSKCSLFIPRTIVNEVRRNVPPIVFSQFIKFIQATAAIDEDFVVPFDLGMKYSSWLKPADSFIAAYADFVGANLLISENRHFLSQASNLPFKILTAEKCLKLLG